MQGISPVAASGGHSSSLCAGLSLSRLLLLRGTVSRRAGSVVVAHGPNCSAACGIFPDQGSNPRPLHRQADSQPLRHQGSPRPPSFKKKKKNQLLVPGDPYNLDLGDKGLICHHCSVLFHFLNQALKCIISTLKVFYCPLHPHNSWSVKYIEGRK